jgi:hypothetical protein
MNEHDERPEGEEDGPPKQMEPPASADNIQQQSTLEPKPQSKPLKDGIFYIRGELPPGGIDVEMIIQRLKDMGFIKEEENHEKRVPKLRLVRTVHDDHE